MLLDNMDDGTTIAMLSLLGRMDGIEVFAGVAGVVVVVSTNDDNDDDDNVLIVLVEVVGNSCSNRVG